MPYSCAVRVLVVTPPWFIMTAPAAAPAVLVSVLRQAGHEALAFDVNRFCVQHLLTGPAIAASLARADPTRLRVPLAQARAATYTIDEAVRSLQHWDTYAQFELYRRARIDIELALNVHAAAHGRSDLSSAGYRPHHDQTDPEQALEAARQGGELFDAALAAAVHPVVAFEPGLVAVSVSAPSQLHGALRFAALLRDALPRTHICLGGATITRLRNAITETPGIFDLCNSVILREGETPLRALADCLDAGRDLEHVEGLLARQAGVVRASPAQIERRYELQALPPPVFDDLMPGPFLTPVPFLPLSTTRNCYFDKCEFCAIGRSFLPGYVELSASQIVRQMLEVRAQHPGAFFKDVSEALRKPVLLEAADTLAATGAPPSWEVYLRLEAPFDSDDVARRLRRGGLRVACFGLESASQEVLEAMNKRIDAKRSERIIQRFADAGIWVHLFLLCGFPRSTERDHEETLAFIDRNRDAIHSVQASPFAMELDSDIVAMSAKYGFVARRRVRASFALDVPLEDRGEIPPEETSRRWVQEIRELAVRGDTTLARSRFLWDSHRIFYAHANDVLRASVPTSRELPVVPPRTGPSVTATQETNA